MLARMGVWYIGILVVVYGDGRRAGRSSRWARSRLLWSSGRARGRAGERARARATSCVLARAVVVVVVVVLFNTVRYTAKRLV